MEKGPRLPETTCAAAVVLWEPGHALPCRLVLVVFGWKHGFGDAGRDGKASKAVTRAVKTHT